MKFKNYFTKIESRLSKKQTVYWT